MTDLLEIALLGEVMLKLGGVPLTSLASRRTEALLIYLVCTRRPHTREALANLLWDTRSQSQALGNLRVLLTSLRQILGPYVTITRQTVAFNLDSPHWLDVAELEAGLVAVREEQPRGDALTPQAVTRLAQTLALYQGDFMQGFYLRGGQDFEEWQVTERERLRLQTIEALNGLVASYLDLGDYPAGLEQGRRLLQLDPLREEAHRQLMLLLAYSGQRNSALSQYEICCQILVDELGVEPMAETTALYEQIRDGTIESLRGAEKSPFPPDPFAFSPPPVPAPLPSVAPSPPPPFVVRERELARLDEFLGPALASQGRVVFVTGEAGSGKTVLAYEFARRAQEAHPDLVVANGNCNAQTGLGDPYLPFREILSLLAGDIEAKSAGGMITRENATRLWSLVPVSVPALVELGPDLIDNFVSGPALLSRTTAFASPLSTLSTGAERGGTDCLARLGQLVNRNLAGQRISDLPQANLFEQYTAVLQALTVRRPLLLLLDDLQWADPSSTSLLFHLGRHIRGNRILLVGIYRPEDVAMGWENTAHPLDGVVSEFKRDFGDIEVDLDQAIELEGRRFVDAWLDSEPNQLDETFRQLLFQHTGGQPLFTIELLRDMQDRGDLRRDSEGRWVAGPALDRKTIPARVEGVIEKRFARLPTELRRALRVASVEGEAFTAEVVANVQGVDEQGLIRSLSAEVVRRHRLVSVPNLQWLGSQPISRYRFRHNLFQRYLYQTLDEVERAHLHGAVGRTLETLYGDQTEQVAVELARHFQAAGNVDQAIDYLLMAGAKARRLLANEEAIGHFRQGLSLLQTLRDSPERAQRELALLIPLGNALIAVKGYAAPEVGQTFRRARELCRQLGDAPELFPVLTGLQRFFLMRGETQMGHELGQQLLTLAQSGTDPTLLTEAHRALGVTLWFQGEFAAAQAHFEQGFALYDSQHHANYVLLYGEDPGVTCLLYRSWALWLLGYPDQALKRSQEALALARELAHPFGLAQTRVFVTALHQFCREEQIVREQAEAALTLSTEHGFAFWQAAGAVLRGWALVEQQAQAEEGVTQIRRGLSAWQTMGIEVARHYFVGLLAEAYGKTGQADQGLSLLTETLANLSEVGRWWETELHRLRGELLLMQRVDAVEAEACFHQAIEIARGQGARSLELRATVSLSRLWREQGKTAEARQVLTEIYNWFMEGFETADLKEARLLLEADDKS